jgi:hypothetical protein
MREGVWRRQSTSTGVGRRKRSTVLRRSGCGGGFFTGAVRGDAEWGCIRYGIVMMYGVLPKGLCGRICVCWVGDIEDELLAAGQNPLMLLLFR